MRGLSITLCCMLLSFAGSAGADSMTGARHQSPSTAQSAATASGPPVSAFFIPDAGFTEAFDDVTQLVPAGWVRKLNSQPPGRPGWWQGNASVFTAYEGAASAYIAANHASAEERGTISEWLILPEMEFRNGDEFAFWARTTTGSEWPDRLELRISTSGDLTDTGADAHSVGSFSSTLLMINENLSPGGFPETWTRYSVFLRGLPAGTSTGGRLAFRYHVADGGTYGNNSNYIGIDSVSRFAYQPGITVSTTSGIDPLVCGTDTSLELEPGSVYYLCQTLRNDGNVPLTRSIYIGPHDTTGAITVDLGVGESRSWIDGPFTVAAGEVLETTWVADNPERYADMQLVRSSAQIVVRRVSSVSVTPASATLLPEATISLSVSVLGTGSYDDAVTWSSSDEGVAIVSSAGVVTAVSPGSATITATSNETPSVSASASVTVQEEILSLALTADELPDITVNAGDKDLTFISVNVAASGTSEVTVSGFRFAAAGLTFSAEPAAAADLEQILESLTLTLDGSPVGATAVFGGSEAVLTLASPLVIQPGASVSLELHADSAAELSAELAAAALAVFGLAAVGLRRRLRVAAVVLIVAVTFVACSKSPKDDDGPDRGPVTASFTVQLTALDSDAAEVTGLPAGGAKVTISY